MQPAPPKSFSVSRDGEHLGDYAASQIAQGIEDGSLLRSDFYWAEGMDVWRPLAELFPHAHPKNEQHYQAAVGELVKTPATSAVRATDSKLRAAAWGFGAAFVVGAILAFINYKPFSAEFVGGWLGSTLGHWGIGGVSIFFSRPENRVRNWVMIIAIWGGFGVIGSFYGAG